MPSNRTKSVLSPCDSAATSAGATVRPSVVTNRSTPMLSRNARAPSGIGPPRAGLIDADDRDHHARDDDAAHRSKADWNSSDRGCVIRSDQIARRDCRSQRDDVGRVGRPDRNCPSPLSGVSPLPAGPTTRTTSWRAIVVPGQERQLLAFAKERADADAVRRQACAKLVEGLARRSPAG